MQNIEEQLNYYKEKLDPIRFEGVPVDLPVYGAVTPWREILDGTKSLNYKRGCTAMIPPVAVLNTSAKGYSVYAYKKMEAGDIVALYGGKLIHSVTGTVPSDPALQTHLASLVTKGGWPYLVDGKPGCMDHYTLEWKIAHNDVGSLFNSKAQRASEEYKVANCTLNVYPSKQEEAYSYSIPQPDGSREHSTKPLMPLLTVKKEQPAGTELTWFYQGSAAKKTFKLVKEDENMACIDFRYFKEVDGKLCGVDVKLLVLKTMEELAADKTLLDTQTFVVKKEAKSETESGEESEQEDSVSQKSADVSEDRSSVVTVGEKSDVVEVVAMPITPAAVAVQVVKTAVLEITGMITGKRTAPETPVASPSPAKKPDTKESDEESSDDVDELKAKVEMMESTLKLKEATIKKKDAKIAELQQKSADPSKIAELQAALAAKDTTISEKDATLAQNADMIRQLQSAAGEREATLLRREAELNEAKALLDATKKQLEEQGVELAAANNTIEKIHHLTKKA